MEIQIGIILALIAMIGWGFGDFFIQKSTRKVGNWETLFIITLFGAIVLTPFVWKDIPGLFDFTNSKIWLLFFASFVLFIAALLDFEALKKGKLAIVEPIWSLEIPVSALLAFFILKEGITFGQIIIILSLIIGLVMVSFSSTNLSKKILLEKGAVIAIIAALFMGIANFFIGWGSRSSDALMMNWFLNVFIAIISLIFILVKSDFKIMLSHTKTQKYTWIGMCLFDNAAWIAFAFALSMAPMAIAVALSDSYIIIAVLLGMFVNKESLHTHQKVGLVLAIVSALILSVSVG